LLIVLCAERFNKRLIVASSCGLFTITITTNR
jgi:hypothetical protein